MKAKRLKHYSQILPLTCFCKFSQFSLFLFFICVWIFLLYTLAKVGIVCSNALCPGLVWPPIVSEASNENKGRRFRCVKSCLHIDG